METTMTDTDVKEGTDGWLTMEGGLKCHVEVVEVCPEWGRVRYVVRDDFGTEARVDSSRFEPRKDKNAR